MLSITYNWVEKWAIMKLGKKSMNFGEKGHLSPLHPNALYPFSDICPEGLYEDEQQRRSGCSSPGSLCSAVPTTYLLIRLTSAGLSPKEGGSKSFTEDKKHSVSAASSRSVYTRGRFPLLSHNFWWLVAFSNHYRHKS